MSRLETAIHAVQKRGFSIKQAAETYNVSIADIERGLK